MPDPGPGEAPAAATALPPALPEIVEPPFQQAPIPAMETSGQWPQNSTSAGPPRLYPPLSVCALPRNRGTNPTIDAPQRATTASGSGRLWALPSAPCSLLLPAIFLYGYIKLAETHSIILRGATSHDDANGDYFSNPPPYMG